MQQDELATSMLLSARPVIDLYTVRLKVGLMIARIGTRRLLKV